MNKPVQVGDVVEYVKGANNARIDNVGAIGIITSLNPSEYEFPTYQVTWISSPVKDIGNDCHWDIRNLKVLVKANDVK